MYPFGELTAIIVPLLPFLFLQPFRQ